MEVTSMWQQLKIVKQMPNLANRQENKTKVIYERTNARKKEEDTKMQTFF